VTAENRVPNLVLRALRNELNLSQDEFARRLKEVGRQVGEPNDCTKRHVQRWESGSSRTCRPIYRRALEALTGRPFTQLGFTAPSPAATLETAELGRRAVLGVGAALASSLLAEAPQVKHLDAGRSVGRNLVETLRARTERFRRLDQYLGGADTFRLYAIELESTANLVSQGSYTEETGCALVGVYAEQAQQAGWAAFDAGDHIRAEALYQGSFDAARAAGDTALMGNALALLAYQQSQAGQDSVETAAAAYREAGASAPTGARVLLAQRLAWAHAAAGQASAAEQALDVAESHLKDPDGQPVPDWAAWADEREQRIIAGRCWSELSRPLRAVPILESVLAEYEDTHARDKALYLSWLAGAYADAGEVEAAAVTTARALDLADGVASARPAHRVALILERLQPHRTLPAVRELLDRAAS
jgi:transcriptional regulator with XRE-family HTH domain